MKDSTPIKTETKSVKHTFSMEERNTIGGDLARAIAQLRGTEAEFDQVKASYKAKTTEGEARIDNLSTSLMNGFEMRNSICVVDFRPADKQKDYYLKDEWEKATDEQWKGEGLPPILTEPMTQDDFQAELLQAESKFDLREEIELFRPTEADSGRLIVGRFAGKWFSAIRMKVGRLELVERLDSEQRAFNLRADAVKTAIKRVKEWSAKEMKEHSKGFEAAFDNVAEAHKERVE